MQDPLLVRRGQPRAELPGHLHGLVLRQAADPAQQRREILAVDVLHRQEVLAVHLVHVVDPADVGVGHWRASLTSFMNRASRPSSRSSALGRNFSATGWPSFRSSAR